MYQASKVIADKRALSAISEVCFSPGGSNFAVTDAGNNEVRLYDTTSGDVLRTYGAIVVFEVDRDVIHWGYGTPRRTGNVLVFSGAG